MPQGKELQSHCKRGHELSAENTYVYERVNVTTGRTAVQRICKACNKFVRAEKKAAAK